jgi:hypothetical protein
MKFRRRSVSIVILLFALTASAFAGSFDGRWAVTLQTPEYKDPTGVVALAYAFQFSAEVHDYLLQGERGNKGEPGWLEISGKIDADGSAMLHVRGITGRREYNLGHVATGRPYEYDVKAHFAGTGGSGSRIGGRISNFAFVKD